MVQSRDDAPLFDEPARAITVSGARSAELAGSFMEPARVLGPLEPESPSPVIQIHQILRFKGTIAGAFLLLALPPILAVWMFTTPQFAAKGEILVRPIIPSLVFRTEENGPLPFYEQYKNTQVAIILGPTVLQRVLDQPEVQKTEWYQHPETPLIGAPLLPMERLRNDLEVHPRGQTEIIDVNMMAKNSRDATTIVNAVLEEYIKYVRESSDKNKDLLYQKLLEEFDGLRNEIEGREKLIARLSKDLGTNTPDSLVNQKRIRLEDAESQLQALDREIALAVWQEKQLEELAGPPTTQKAAASQPSPDVRYSMDDEWRRLYLALLTARHEFQTAQVHLGQDHPRNLELKERIEFVETQLQSRQSQLDKEWASGVLSTPGSRESGTGFLADRESQRQKIKKLQYDRELLFADMEKQRTSFEQTFNSAQMLNKETDMVHRRRELYDAMRARLDQKEMERKVPGSIEINSQALPATKPASDRRMIFTLMALIAGLMGGVAAAFLRVTLNRTIQEPGELSRHTQAPFLGRLPLVPTAEKESLENCPVQGEFVRMIRTHLLQRLEAQHGNTILMTSAVPGEGKTTTAIMLARSLASIGRKVLLVDTDLRNPALSNRFALEVNSRNLPAARDAAGLKDRMFQTATEGLTLLPIEAFGSTMNSEFFSHRIFADWVNQWRKEFDIVLIDSSPVLPVADARILSRQMDGTILVVREGCCHRDQIKEALACLSASGARLLGTIYLGENRQKGYDPRYYGKYYQHASQSA
jgi:polysaccharide biosynthesis transport protein